MKLTIVLGSLLLAGCSFSKAPAIEGQVGRMTSKQAVTIYGAPALERKTADGGTVMVWTQDAKYQPAYVPPRGPTYGAAAVVRQDLTQGRIPYGRLREQGEKLTLGFDASGVLRTWSSERSGMRN